MSRGPPRESRLSDSRWSSRLYAFASSVANTNAARAASCASPVNGCGARTKRRASGIQSVCAVFQYCAVSSKRRASLNDVRLIDASASPISRAAVVVSRSHVLWSQVATLSGRISGLRIRSLLRRKIEAELHRGGSEERRVLPRRNETTGST